jgi:N-dimethylarginine dimethylaminohydrolase
MFNLKIKDEFSPLKAVIVGYGQAVPQYNEYLKNRYDWLANIQWDKELLLRQQENFFNVLKKYGVEVLLTDVDRDCPWQMYTRDIGFVYQDKFIYFMRRELHEREFEFESIEKYFQGIDPARIIKIKNGKVEGGDVLVDSDQLYIGLSDRTNEEGIQEIEKYFPVKRLYLGKRVMHLDTRMTILPGKNLLIYPGAFTRPDLEYLRERFNFIEVTEEEALSLGTNVFIINPETIVVNKAHRRIQSELQQKGFKVEVVDYSEPIVLEGSFRCTTLPVWRE